MKRFLREARIHYPSVIEGPATLVARMLDVTWQLRDGGLFHRAQPRQLVVQAWPLRPLLPATRPARASLGRA